MSSTATTPTKSFQDLGLSETTLESLAAMNYETPTPVQQQAIPLALSGKDLVVQSRTGTGKTAAFGIPVVESIDADQPVVQAMALTPTRELTAQVCEELSRIGQARGLKVIAIYGGDSMDRQIAGLEGGAQIVVGTPGRVLDLLKRRELKLDACRTLVLDEADKMLDMGFAQEMSEIMAFVPSERQTSLFSATVPLGIRGLIHNYLNEPEWISLSEDFAYVKEVRHTYIIAPAAHKEEVLYKLIELDQPTSSMIFCNTRNEVRSVSNFLSRRGLPRRDDLERPDPGEARAGDGSLPQRNDSAPGRDRRRGPGHRRRRPLPRLHLLDARLARGLHPPRRAGPGAAAARATSYRSWRRTTS